MRSRATRLAAAILGLALAASGCRFTPNSSSGRESTSARASAPARESSPALEEPQSVLPTLPSSNSARTPAGPDRASFESPFVDVAERVLPSVVNIDAERRLNPTTDPSVPSQQRELYRDLFPDSDPDLHLPSTGSGFVIDSEGIVVTNQHVIEGSDRIRITTSDGETHPAEIIGLDPSTDIAVLRVETKKRLPAARLGDSEEIRVGDWAIAIGNPFGKLEGSVTVGVVSAKGRGDLDIEGGTATLQDFIQTDASINFGNSGGPLVNIHGEVIGMNTAINPGGQGIGFAIPVNLVRRTVEQLVEHGRVIRGYLGIYPQELTPDLAEGRGLSGVHGVLVGQVLPETPAARAGVERGDVITKIGGREVSSVHTFRMLVADAPIGKRVPMDLLRGGKRIGVDIVPAERPDQVVVAAPAESPPVSETEWFGLEVLEITPEVREALGLAGDESGIVIESVRNGSPGERAGLEPGQVIKEIGDRIIRNLADFEAAREASQDATRPVVFLVRSDAVTRFLAVRPE
jgi:Do/DeqQ family serine protease